MAEPFLAELRIMSFNFPPKGWAECNGQFLPINQNQALFSLLGTSYGGNGQTTFALPDLRGRVPVHYGGALGVNQGTRGGQETHTLTQSEMPQHLHSVNANATTAPSVGGNAPGSGKLLATSQGAQAYASSPTNLTPFATDQVTNAGGSQAHTNQQPFLALEICIALQGIFPSRN